MLMQALYSKLIKDLHQYAKDRQLQRAVLGLSGGLDSTVTLCLAVRAFGPKNVTVLMLPENGVTPPEDTEHARALAAHFGCHSIYQPINNFLVDYQFVPWDRPESAEGQLKGYVRSTLLRHFADSNQALFLGSANKSDLLLGFGTVEGEFAGDLQPLGDLYKTEVLEMGHFIGLPEAVLEKMPSRCRKLRATDEDELGAPWAQIDDILIQLQNQVDPQSMIDKGMDALTVHRTMRMLQEYQGRFQKLPILPTGRNNKSIEKAREAEASSLA
jgi:NAD+ synthetase